MVSRQMPDPNHLLLPRSTTANPGPMGQYPMVRGKQRPTDMEQLLSGLSERMQPPVVWRLANDSDSTARRRR